MNSSAKRSNMPKPGDVFSVPLKNGHFGLCRVLSISEIGPVVAALDWIGQQPPNLPEVGRPPILMLNSFHWNNEPCIYAVMGRKPAAYKRIGMIEPSPSEAKIKWKSVTRWDVIALHILNEWRWKYDRDALIAEVEAEKNAEREKIAREEAEELASLSFDRLRNAELFESWKDTVPNKVIEASRTIIRETIDALVNLPPQASDQEKLIILQRCIESFNSLNARYKHFIETVEREDIMKVFNQLVWLSGLRGREDLGDQWRDW